MEYRRTPLTSVRLGHDNTSSHQGLCSPTIFKNGRSLVLRAFLYSETFECITTSDWLKPYGLANQMLCYIRLHENVKKKDKECS